MDNKTVPGDSSGLAATVPGAVKGWFDTLHHFGSGKVRVFEICIKCKSFQLEFDQNAIRNVYEGGTEQ